jgi:hypothetical protein
MATITEMGFSISHEFEGGIATKSTKTTTVREWLGDSQGSNVVRLSGSDGGYETITIAGIAYTNAKIVGQSSSYEGDQHFKDWTVEQKIDGGNDCSVFCGMTADQLESYSENISTSKTKDSASYTRSFSVQIAGKDQLASSPNSPSGSALIDKSINCIQAAFGQAPDFTSIDDDINDLIANAAVSCDPDGNYSKTKTESIDRVGCSVSMSETTTKKLGDDDCCVTSETYSLNWDENGLVTINVSGSINGQCEKYECAGGERVGISKTKYDYALECFEDIDINQLLQDQYEKHKLEACETDVCLALRLTNKSETHCKEEGNISYSGSATEEEVGNCLGVTSFVYEQSSKNGCIISMTRTFDINAPVNQNFVKENPEYLDGDCTDQLDCGDEADDAIKKAEAELANIDFDAPADFFGPLSLTINKSPSQGTISGSMSFTNDPQYDVDIDGLIKKKTITTTVCQERKDNKKYNIPCGAAVFQSTVAAPGYTRKCIDVEAFPCATVKDIENEVDLQVPAGAVVTEDTMSVSVSRGAKTGSSCVKYHTAADLKECN